MLTKATYESHIYLVTNEHILTGFIFALSLLIWTFISAVMVFRKFHHFESHLCKYWVHKICTYLSMGCAGASMATYLDIVGMIKR